MKLELNINAAEQRLAEARKKIDLQKDVSFWKQCVRDASGILLKYSGLSSRYGAKYFHGYQPSVQYTNTDELMYVQACVRTREKFYHILPLVPKMDLHDFKELLELLRHTLEYRPVSEWLHQRFSTPAHTIIVREEVIVLAEKYSDPYATGNAKGPIFATIDPNGQPRDEVEENTIIHLYPTLDFSDQYFSSALSILKNILENEFEDGEKYVHNVADFFQLLINLHYFAAMNASLYMNMANGLLEIVGIEGIEHGIVDFVALRLQPENFRKYFYDLAVPHVGLNQE